MTDIVKNELERNVKELERCVEQIVAFTNTTEEIMKLKIKTINSNVRFLSSKHLCISPIPHNAIIVVIYVITTITVQISTI